MKVVCATRVGNMKDPDPAVRGKVGVVDMPLRELRDDEVLIQVAYCGICGSDPHIVDGCFNSPDDVPFGLGHEMSGIIVQLGKAAVTKGLRVGDRVGGNFLGYCGKCHFCGIGQPEYCTSVGNEPCMAEYVIWKESQVYKLPDGVSLRQGSLMEPLSIAVRAMDKAGIQVGKRVLISGGGPIGLLCAQLAARSGAAELTLSEPVAQRCDLARKAGVEHIIDPVSEDVYARAMEITGGLGYDVILECSAAPAAAEAVLCCTAKYANVLYVAQYPTDYVLPLNLFEYCYMRQVSITGMYCAHFNFARTAEYLKYVDLSAFTGDEQVYDIDDAEAAFAMHLTSRYPKILIRCSRIEGE